MLTVAREIRTSVSRRVSAMSAFVLRIIDSGRL